MTWVHTRTSTLATIYYTSSHLHQGGLGTPEDQGDDGRGHLINRSDTSPPHHSCSYSGAEGMLSLRLKSAFIIKTYIVEFLASKWDHF